MWFASYIRGGEAYGRRNLTSNNILAFVALVAVTIFVFALIIAIAVIICKQK
jgi:hypothetical protein